MVRQRGETSNTCEEVFEALAEWEAQLKPFENDLPEMEP